MRRLFTLVLATTPILGLVVFDPHTAEAQCQCTDYVAKVKGLTGYPAAYKWATTNYLSNNGYRKLLSPSLGAIVVFQPTYGNGIDPTYGHVGVIRAIDLVKDNRGNVTGWKLTIWNANMTPDQMKWFSDAGCKNVSVMTATVSKTASGISYWIK